MASWNDQVAAALRQAIAGALQDSESLFSQLISELPKPSGGTAGGSSGSLVDDILSLIGLIAILSPEALGVIGTLKTAESGGGSEGLSFSVGYFVASTLLTFAEPYTRYVQHEIENAAQSQIFDPVTAADLAARQIITQQFGESEAGGGGFDKSHFDQMLDAARNRPAYDVALRLWNRGYIGEDLVNVSLQYAGVPEDWWTPIKELRREILTPADFALASLRGVVTEDDALAGAAAWGLTADDFATLVGNTGEPPGLMQMLEGYRRDFIDVDTLERGIRQSRVRNEWIPLIEKLRYEPMSTAVAASAVVRGYLSYDQGASIAQQNGLEPEHWRYVYENNGRPLSHEQLLTLHYRGELGLDEVKQGIRESDIKDKYIDAAVELGSKRLPLFEAVSLLKNGTISADTFTRQLLDQGYQKALVDEIAKAAHVGKVATPKHLTVGDITELYLAKVYNHRTAHDALLAIGYTPDDADSVLEVADVRQAGQTTKSQIAIVKHQFDRYKLTDDQAADDLKAIGLDDMDTRKLVAAWRVVRPEGTKELTEPQVVKLFKVGLVKTDDALSRLQAIGYTHDDAELLLKAYG